MKVWVAIWHHKHGTNIETASSEQLARKVMAERVLDAMDYQKSRWEETAQRAFSDGSYNGVFTLWTRYEGIEDSFEFIESNLYEEKPT